MGPGNRYVKQGDGAWNFVSFDSSQRAGHFGVFVCRGLMGDGRVVAMGSARAGVALAWFGPWDGRFGRIF